MFKRVVIFLLGEIAGFLMIKYYFEIKQMTGSIPWAEKVFGSAGTYTLIKLIGVLIMIGSLLYLTGTLQDVMWMILGKFMPGSGQPAG